MGSPDHAPRLAMERRHAAWLDLRDTAGAVRLAVQILDGPLHPGADPPPPRERVHEVIATLEQATRRLCGLIDELQPAANDPMPEPEPTPRAALLAPAREQPVATAPAKTEPRRSPRKPQRPALEPGYGTALDPILRALELHVRAPEHGAVALDVSARPGLRVLGDGDELLRVLVGLVEDAATPTGTTVRLRVWLDPVEDLGDAMDVVFEVRSDGAHAGVPRGPGLDAAQASWGPARVCVHASPAPGRVLVRVPQAR